MTMAAILAIVLPLLKPVGGALASWLAVELVRFIRTKTKVSMSKKLRTDLSDAAYASVAAVAQTVKKRLAANRAAADGPNDLTAEDKSELHHSAVDIMKSTLGDQGIKLLKQVKGSKTDVDRVLGDAIESMIHLQKGTRNL